MEQCVFRAVTSQINIELCNVIKRSVKLLKVVILQINDKTKSGEGKNEHITDKASRWSIMCFLVLWSSFISKEMGRGRNRRNGKNPYKVSYPGLTVVLIRWSSFLKIFCSSPFPPELRPMVYTKYGYFELIHYNNHIRHYDRYFWNFNFTRTSTVLSMNSSTMLLGSTFFLSKDRISFVMDRRLCLIWDSMHDNPSPYERINW